MPCAGVWRGASAGAATAGSATGAATCTVPRCWGLLEMRIFIPLSEVISMESTVDSSIMSISFFTYRRSIISIGLSKFDQFAVEMREDHRSLRPEMHIVLDADPAPIRPIDPGFDCHHRTFGERAVRRPGQSRRLVHFQPEAVPQAVSEQIPKTALLNVVSGECVGIPARHTGPNVCRRALVRDA